LIIKKYHKVFQVKIHLACLSNKINHKKAMIQRKANRNIKNKKKIQIQIKTILLKFYNLKQIKKLVFIITKVRLILISRDPQVINLCDWNFSMIKYRIFHWLLIHVIHLFQKYILMKKVLIRIAKIILKELNLNNLKDFLMIIFQKMFIKT